MFIAGLFTRDEAWRQPRCLSVGEGINRTRCKPTMEYDLAIKENGIWPFGATRIGLEAK